MSNGWRRTTISRCQCLSSSCSFYRRPWGENEVAFLPTWRWPVPHTKGYSESSKRRYGVHVKASEPRSVGVGRRGWITVSEWELQDWSSAREKWYPECVSKCKDRSRCCFAPVSVRGFKSCCWDRALESCLFSQKLDVSLSNVVAQICQLTSVSREKVSETLQPPGLTCWFW